MNGTVKQYIFRRRRCEQILAGLSPLSCREIEKAIEPAFASTAATMGQELRPTNRVDQFLQIERHRLLLEEVARRENRGTPVPEPFSTDVEHPGMVWIPGGEAVIGVDRGFMSREEPRRPVQVLGFWIDSTSVTNEAYHQICGSHVPPSHSAAPEAPVLAVHWYEAHRYAAKLGKRLVRFAEWECAARGPRSLLFPWGDEFDAGKACVWPAHGPAHVKSYPPGDSGLYETSGSVWEFTQEIHTYRLSTESRIHLNFARGGSWRSCKWGARATMFICVDLVHRSDDVGFRCASSF